ncbi:hypothetical protein Hs30E_20440 [Lactococcus hodotermopsidis]|uniref:Uncharacterized protein n=1 Tax=Pseudolactococcus hodotermopsidis TaxID=2709157 RepID=A0A6A0BFN1_9LACT|nr:Imm59 family immunity protein [Lactococcus hodotermopsidis]GFH43515.1 hypothetical protein Hs30E_20440 [Lactococcus hodotermopsidis]
MSNEILENQKLELEEEIKKLGYGSLRYSLLKIPAQNRNEWQRRIDYENGKYFVYLLADRESLMGSKKEFNNFEEAKKEFLARLEGTVELNRMYIQAKMPVEYSSPLWDNYN